MKNRLGMNLKKILAFVVGGFVALNLFCGSSLTFSKWSRSGFLSLLGYEIFSDIWVDEEVWLGERPADASGSMNEDRKLTELFSKVASMRSERSRLYAELGASEHATKSSPRQRSRTLLGILVDFSNDGITYRRKFRQLFPWHPHVCSLAEFENVTSDTADCEIIYTFVVAAWKEEHLPGQKFEAPFLISPDTRRRVCANHTSQDDCMEPDMTILDIRENMNDGKSPTWMAYGSWLAQKLDIDYVGKQDTDSVTMLDRFLRFSRQHLPPAPYNKNILVGLFANKLTWFDKKTMEEVLRIGEEEQTKATGRIQRREGPFMRKYGTPLRPYAQGQFYILSQDLAEAVAREAATEPDYTHSHEDHDVSAFAMIGARRPIKFIIISRHQWWWEHDVKAGLGEIFHERWELEYNRTQDLVRAQFGAEVYEQMKHRVSRHEVRDRVTYVDNL